MGRYFGVPLEELVYRENCNVPSLVVSCATAICKQGMGLCYFQVVMLCVKLTCRTVMVLLLLSVSACMVSHCHCHALSCQLKCTAQLFSDIKM